MVGVPLEDVELRGRFEVIHEGPFGGANSQTLSWMVEVDGRETVRGVG